MHKVSKFLVIMLLLGLFEFLTHLLFNFYRISHNMLPVVVHLLLLSVIIITLYLNNRREKIVLNGKQYYDSLFESTSDIFYSLDLMGRFTNINPAGERILGYSKDELLGSPCFLVIPPDAMEVVTEGLRLVLKNGESKNLEIDIINKTGNRIKVDITASPVIQNGKINGVIGVAKDVTEKRMAEYSLDIQNKILEMVAVGRPYKQILDEIVRMIETISSDTYCCLLLKDKTKNELVHGAAPSLPEEYNKHMNGIKIAPNVGSCGTAAYYKEPVFVSDIENDPRWIHLRDAALKHNLRSCWSYPILDNSGEVLGTFGIYNRDVWSPQQADIELVERATHLTQLTIQHYQSEEKINYMAFHDPLTGLPNRRLFEEKMKKALEEASVHNHNLVVMFIDLDRFKLVNDSLGHNVGDVLLKEVSHRLQNCLRKNDIVCRQGGDEFIILLEDASKDQMVEILQRIFRSISLPFLLENNEIFVTPSIGVSIYPSHGIDAVELIKKADLAMYYAKRDGKNDYKIYEKSLEVMSLERFETEASLRRALERNEFTLLYQPKFNVNTNQIVGVEALLRWNHPTIGLVSPDKFIPVAEETGLIVPIGKWVLRTACDQLKAWNQLGFTSLNMGVNLSFRQFYQTDLIRVVSDIIAESGIEPQYLELEITESMTMNVEAAKAILNKLKELGVRIAIDDFGTGYSSLNYLKKFPIDCLKIDQSFVRDIAMDDSDRDIITTIISMGHNLKLEVIAEGVETEEQLLFLKKHGCDVVQGYYYSRPQEAKYIESTFLLNHEKKWLCVVQK